MKLEIAVIAIAAIAVLSIGIASAYEPVQLEKTGSMSTHNMMRGMHASNMMQSSSMHSEGSMRDMMKEHHADLTDEEINEMMENCPMHKA